MKSSSQPSFLAEHADDQETAHVVYEVLAKLGVRDERIFEALCKLFEEDEMPGAGNFADYGDPRAPPLLEGAIKAFEPDFERMWSGAQAMRPSGRRPSPKWFFAWTRLTVPSSSRPARMMIERHQVMFPEMHRAK